MDNLQVAWEKRATIFKTKKEAVMQQSLPSLFKDHIDKLQKKEILSFLPNGKCKVLDIGCGYGRIAEDVVKTNNLAIVYGIDLSRTFVDLFNKSLKGKAQAVVGDIRHLPFNSNNFEYVFSVASLLYLRDEKDQKQAIREIFRVLRKDGIAVFIEPDKLGWNIINFFGLIPFLLRNILRRKKVETFGSPFENGRIEKLIKLNKGVLVKKKGYPIITFMFVPILIFSKIIPPVAKLLLYLSKKMDDAFPLTGLSYWITYVAKK